MNKEKVLDLVEKVEVWATEKGIFEKGTVEAQMVKTLEEITEMQMAIIKDDKEEIKDALGDIFITIIVGSKMANTNIRECIEDYCVDENKIEMDKMQRIGTWIHLINFYLDIVGEPYDKNGSSFMLILLSNYADVYDLKIEECLESAYNVIAKRKGKMIDGMFVKEVQ